MICPKGCKDGNGEPIRVDTYRTQNDNFITRRERCCPKCSHIFETVELPREILDIFYARQKRFHEDYMADPA